MSRLTDFHQARTLLGHGLRSVVLSQEAYDQLAFEIAINSGTSHLAFGPAGFRFSGVLILPDIWQVKKTKEKK